MANNYKRLGATTVTANTDTNLYTVPASHEAIVKSVTVCNIGSTARTFRIACVDGAIGAVANEDYQFYDTTIGANDSLIIQPNWTLIATHSILVRAAHAEVVFSCFGDELDV